VSDTDWIDVDNHGFKEGDMVDFNGVQCPVFSKIGNSYRVRDISGILVLADAIKDNGALTSLDISSNKLGAEQKRDLQRICVAGGIKLTK
jgi:hypothetical protein